MLHAATVTMMPAASLLNEMRSGDVVTDGMMTVDYSQRIGLPRSVRADQASRSVGACRTWIGAETEAG
jgi:hypothetical protein